VRQQKAEIDINITERRDNSPCLRFHGYPLQGCSKRSFRVQFYPRVGC
jgi:hypothetical protein